MSSTYRQSSHISEAAKKIDPQNDTYSHFPAHRLPAEIIRDNALAASNLLVRTIGGPSVYPYQPEGIWAALATRNATAYQQQHGDSLYRRSLYTIWKRSSPPPSMTNFDAPDRYYCVVRRQKTSTPLQSLVLMNDPQFVEAARKLAERAMQRAAVESSARIAFVFRALIGRSPRQVEADLLLRLYQEELASLTEERERIKALLSIGESPVDLALDQLNLAAYTLVASTIMNFDEFVMKR